VWNDLNRDGPAGTLGPSPSFMVTARPLRIGLVGCGTISNAYFKGLAPFPRLAKITACADLEVDRARAKAAENGIAKSGPPAEILADPDIDLILNLTIPAAHAEVNRQALDAGKHVYCEKPFALSYADGVMTMDRAKSARRLVGCAPDTVLGPGIQTCRRVIDAGRIGRPVAATANMLSHGVESWHPNPAFYYQAGGGPLFDMGPYYLTALVTMLGPFRSVAALARISLAERIVTSAPLRGTRLKVETPTHLCAAVEFAQGAIGTVTMSFDTWQHGMPRLEIYGTEGTVQCPDPNDFDGAVRVWTAKTGKWEDVPVAPSPLQRGLGVADLADALHTGRPHRASGDLGLHVLEVMESFHVSSDSGRRHDLQSTCAQPAAMPPGVPFSAAI
jgi:predicted dehydrogenase